MNTCQISPLSRPTSLKSWIWAPARSIWRKRRESNPFRKPLANQKIRVARVNSIKVQNRTCLTLSTRITEIWTNLRRCISHQNQQARNRNQRQEWPWIWPRMGYRWARTWRQTTSAWSRRNLKRPKQSSCKTSNSPSESVWCNRWTRSPRALAIARVKSHCLR